MALIRKDRGYRWQFGNVGGCPRVKISSGEDIAHLSELDPTMWTVLSCPVKGLEISEKSLGYIDMNGDGKIRVQDVVATAKWLTGVLKDKDLILAGAGEIDIEQINLEDESGRKLYASAKQVLENLGKEGSVVTLTDVADISAIFAKTRFNGDGVIIEASADDADEKAAIAAAVATVGSVADRSGVAGVDAAKIDAFYAALAAYVAWREAEVEAPFGADTDAAIAAYNALDAKIKDFFVRSKLAAFSPDSTASLDVQTSLISSISAENLTLKTEEIASYPIARVTGKAEIDLSEPVNPAWAAQFNTIRTIALKDKNVLTEEDWNAVGAQFAAYTAWKGAKAGAEVEGLGLDAVRDFLAKDRKAALMDLVAKDLDLADEAENIELVSKFLYLMRDFYRLLRNFVTLEDFYDKDKSTPAIFQSGTLVIDQRSCYFCMKVLDMAKHNSTAAPCGMYLLYCDCTAKGQAGDLQIVAAVTVGEVGDLFVGKNAIYYDNAGVEWDAVITKIVDNPISIGQAFWSPYRRMSKTVEDLISKKAAEKDAKMMADANAKITSAPSAVAAPADAKDPKAADAVKPPFDIAKFAGIFAAIGMAVGMIGSALVSLFTGLSELKWWELVMVFVGLMLLISGPAMVLAWLKLRRRNISPLLNANGWAINASSRVSIPFGETLTDMARFPKLKLKDPFAKAGMASWKKWCISIASVAVIGAGLWLGNLLSWANLPSPLKCFQKTEVEVVVEEVAVEAAPAEEPAAAETENVNN
jgi:Flp pilus assembly protein protease CpaA